MNPNNSSEILYENVKYLEIDKVNKYCHKNTILSNKKYKNLLLVHDYGLEEDTIVNYNFVQKSHKLKQKNFYEYIHSGQFLCFITILFESNLGNIEYERMSNVLKNKYGLTDFIIVIFTNDKTEIPSNIPECYEFVILENEYRDDVHRSDDYRINLYKDMWNKFTDVMKKYGYKYASFDEQFDINLMPKLNVDDLHELSLKESLK
jgi:hypothetical protein